MNKILISFAALMLVASPAFAAPNADMEKVVMTAPSVPSKGASQVVSGFYSTLVSAMKSGKSFDARAAQMKPAIERAFNLKDMMRTAAGPGWIKASPEQQAKLVSAFRSFSVANYASQFKAYDGEKFEVKGEEATGQGDVIVKTVLTSGSDTHELNYLMRRGPQGWQIVDVYLNGTISEMASRRSEFSSVLREQGPDALQKMLDQKSQTLANS